MISFRVKYWLMLCGGNIVVTLFFAAAHSLGFLLFGLAMAYGSWSMAHYLLEKDAEELLKKLEGRE